MCQSDCAQSSGQHDCVTTQLCPWVDNCLVVRAHHEECHDDDGNGNGGDRGNRQTASNGRAHGSWAGAPALHHVPAQAPGRTLRRSHVPDDKALALAVGWILDCHLLGAVLLDMRLLAMGIGDVECERSGCGDAGEPCGNLLTWHPLPWDVERDVGHRSQGIVAHEARQPRTEIIHEILNTLGTARGDRHVGQDEL